MKGLPICYLLNPDGGEIPAGSRTIPMRRSNRAGRETEYDFYFGSNRTGRDEVWKMAACWRPSGARHERGRHDGYGINHGRFLYYAKGAIAPNTIWRVAVAGGKEEPVVDGLSDSTNFTVAERGLYFLAAEGSPLNHINRFVRFRHTQQNHDSPGRQKKLGTGMAVSPRSANAVLTQRSIVRTVTWLVDGFK